MKQDDALRKRQTLVARLPITGRSCAARCSSAQSGRMVSAAPSARAAKGTRCGRTRQFSLRGDQVAAARRWLSNYQELKDAIEVICELNHALLRPEPEAPKARRRA
jgi:hypothetical protein